MTRCCEIGSWRRTGPRSATISGVGRVCATDVGRGMSAAVRTGLLPKAVRPTRNLYLEVYTFDGTSGGLRIQTDGKMYAYSGSSFSFTSLAAVPTSTPFTLKSIKWLRPSET